MTWDRADICQLLWTPHKTKLWETHNRHPALWAENDALVELILPKNANIYVSAYQLYLPDKNLMQAKVKEWIKEFNEREEE